MTTLTELAERDGKNFATCSDDELRAYQIELAELGRASKWIRRKDSIVHCSWPINMPCPFPGDFAKPYDDAERANHG